MNRTQAYWLRRHHRQHKRLDALLARRHRGGLFCRIRRALRTPWWKFARLFR